MNQPEVPNSIRSPLSRLHELSENMWFSYGTIILLQLKVIWGLWQYRDLTSGDTSFYFRHALLWSSDLKNIIIWSPLYTAFLGTLNMFIGNAFWVTVIARIIIVLCAAILALAILRKILPKPLAWFIAMWWVILPINFDTLYTVHLFSVLVVFLNFAVIAYIPNVYGRGISLGLFVVTTVLVRNEYSIALVLWLLFCIGYEWYQRRKGIGEFWGRIMLAYGVSVFAAVALIFVFYTRSDVQFPLLSEYSKPKHTLNVCQIYAYNRQQQGDLWQGSPWTDCQAIILRDFSTPEPTLFEAFGINPDAILGHFWWNINLIPDGLQLSLFDHYGGSNNPDYVPAKQATIAWVLLFVVIQTIVFGLYKLRQQWQSDWAKHLQPQLLLWVNMLCTVLVAVIVMVYQRPRPSYTFNLSFFIMALFGLSLFILLRKSLLAKVGTWLMPLAVITILLIFPPYYDVNYLNRGSYSGQPLRQTYEPLLSVISDNNDSQLVILARISPSHVCNYLRYSACEGLHYPTIIAEKPIDLDLPTYFVQLEVDWVYMDAVILSLPVTELLRDELLAAQWQIAASGVNADGNWMILGSPNNTTP